MFKKAGYTSLAFIAGILIGICAIAQFYATVRDWNIHHWTVTVQNGGTACISLALAIFISWYGIKTVKSRQ